jgi:NADP-dependent 3-hydroxy acid dehydrogenase YdfG
VISTQVLQEFCVNVIRKSKRPVSFAQLKQTVLDLMMTGRRVDAAEGARIGFVGLGHMGRPMAERIVAAGFPLVGFDAAGTAERLPDGADGGAGVEDVAARADTLLLSLPDGAVVLDVIDAVAAAEDRRATTVVDLSTTGPAAAVEAATRLADVLVPPMVERGRGRVVLLGSRVAHGMPGRAQYAATKAALVALARSWASEVVAKGVTINVVAPAAAGTPMLEDPARVASAPRVPPLGRLIDPAEIAELVAYLLSPAAAAITGQELTICGGASLAS